MPDLRPADEQRHLGVAERDQVVIDIAVGRYALGELEILGGVDDEVGGGTHVAQHLLGAVEHLRVLCVGLDVAGRDAVDLAQLRPAAMGELLEEGVRHRLVQQSVVAG